MPKQSGKGKHAKRFCSPQLKKILALRMRQTPTPAEERLWRALAAEREQTGLRFTRQRLIRGWIADFYCAAARLIVEADGPVHQLRAGRDAFRDKILADQNILTLRFSNDRIMRDLPRVMAEIRRAAYTRLDNVKPPPRRRKGSYTRSGRKSA